MLKLIALIPVLPLLGVAINGLFGRRMSKRAVGLVGCGVILASLLLSAGAVLELSHLPADARYAEASLGTWMPLGPAGPHGETVTIDSGITGAEGSGTKPRCFS